MEQRVEFSSEGETLVGTLFRPDGVEGPLPTVVAAGGWCYVKEIVLPHVARIVNQNNVQFLGFDYRGFGESGGSRRQHLDPWMQIADLRTPSLTSSSATTSMPAPSAPWVSPTAAGTS